MFRSSCNLLVLSILPGLSSMSCRYFQISTSVLWLIIIVPRVAPIAQTLWGHSTAPAKLNISGMELNVKVCFLYLCLIKFLNQLEIAVFLAVCLVVWAFIFSSFCVSMCSLFCISFERLEQATSEFSDISDLVPKLRRENEAKSEVALIGIQNKEPC